MLYLKLTSNVYCIVCIQRIYQKAFIDWLCQFLSYLNAFVNTDYPMLLISWFINCKAMASVSWASLLVFTEIIKLTKVGSGPSSLDADEWRRMLTSREFGTSSTDLRKTFAQVIKKLCIEELESTTSLEAFTACRLIPLDKKTWIATNRCGWSFKKKVITIFKKDITNAAGPLQLSAGQEAGAEAAMHAMRDIFANKDTEAFLLIDPENAFNSISRKIFYLFFYLLTLF